MKKLIGVIGIITFLSMFTNAQNQSNKVDIKWGNEIKISRRKTLSSLLGHDANGFYAIQREQKGLFSRSSELTLDRYDSNANQVKSVDLNLTDGKNDREYEKIIYIKGKYFLFTSYPDKKTKLNTLYVQTIDMDALAPNNDSRKIADIDYSGNRSSNNGNFMVTLSNDASKILVFYTLPFERGEKEKFGFSVFDGSMNPIWSQNITLPYNNELFDIERYRVENNGDIYLQCTVYKEKRRKKRHGEPNYQYTILHYKNGEQLADEYKIDMSGKFITDLQFSVKSNQDIMCTGFFSDMGTYSIKGAYFTVIDGKTKEIKSQSFKEFSIDVLLENLTERQQKKIEKKLEKGKEVELYEYDLDNIILREDGGALLVGEQYFMNAVTTTQYVNGVTTTTTNYYYNYNDIIVVDIDPSGQIGWVTKIPKRQNTVNDNGFFSSYAMCLIKDKIYFLFNDHPDNLLPETNETKKFKSFSGQKGSVVVLAELSYDGKHTKEALFNSADAEVLIRPKVCSKISSNEMIIYGQRKKTQRFARVIFK